MLATLVFDLGSVGIGCSPHPLLIIMVSSVIFFAGVLFVHQPGLEHVPGASVTQVNNYSVHTLSTFLRIRENPSMQIFWVLSQ